MIKRKNDGQTHANHFYLVDTKTDGKSRKYVTKKESQHSQKKRKSKGETKNRIKYQSEKLINRESDNKRQDFFKP